MEFLVSGQTECMGWGVERAERAGVGVGGRMFSSPLETEMFPSFNVIMHFLCWAWYKHWEFGNESQNPKPQHASD